ncbi:MAG TPA: c-type cytochrome [Acidobacteriaceae bacterium]|jgi:mono/diheme cytochrome c family protein|nr:c-type cytochrome [Acidobacteriaceae bacterium]
MLKPFLIVPALFFLGAPALLQQDQATTAPATTAPASTAPASTTPQAATEFKVPADLIGKINPVKPTPEALAKAKQFYGWDCAMCHGDNGDGKGDVAAEQKLTIHNFRDPDSLAKMSDGELYYIIQNGKGKMPGDGDRLKGDSIWNMVLLLRKMSNTQAPTQAPAQAPTTATAPAQAPAQ